MDEIEDTAAPLPKFAFLIGQSSLFYFISVSSSFYYKDGQGSIADGQGNEATDYEEEYDPYNVNPLMTASNIDITEAAFRLESRKSLTPTWKKFQRNWF